MAMESKGMEYPADETDLTPEQVDAMMVGSVPVHLEVPDRVGHIDVGNGGPVTLGFQLIANPGGRESTAKVNGPRDLVSQ